jgi:hypothetical protein
MVNNYAAFPARAEVGIVGLAADVQRPAVAGRAAERGLNLGNVRKLDCVCKAGAHF